MKEKGIFDVYQKANLLVLRGYTLIGAVLVGAYWLEVKSGNRTTDYYILFSLITLIPIIAGWISYFVKKNSKYIKYGVIICYGFFYAFVLFTGATGNTFTYIYPMMVIITIYSDLVLSILFNSFAVIANIAYVFVLSRSTALDGELLASIKIQIGVTAIVAFYSIMVSVLSGLINGAKNRELQAEKDNVSNMLDNVLKVSKKIDEGSELVRTKMLTLGNAMNATKESMSEVNSGTNDSANSIQSQLMQTEDVQGQIEKLTSVTDTIADSIHTTKESIETGRNNIMLLREQVSVSEEASSTVSREIASLNEYTGQMNTIIEMIQNVADQTSLLALNASIEAARAGEFGKGFAVVAGEITHLANQTKSATVDINALISSINKELDGVVTAVDELIVSNKSQNASAAETVKSFADIEEHTEQVSTQSEILAGTMAQLSSNNRQIVDNVQTVSAIMEEVAAHATQTFTISEENINIVDEVSELVADLNGMAAEMADGKEQE